MDITSSRTQERENPSATTAGDGLSLQLIPTPPLTPTPTSTPTPKPISRSHETNPYPTTFVQADTSTFKQVVQMLTGTDPPPPPPPPSASRGSIPLIKTAAQKKQGFKLYERRNTIKNGLMINTLHAGFYQNSGFSPRKPEILSPSILDFPALVLCPVTPMNADTVSKSSAALSPTLQEDKAIAEKKFYFHPSPRNAEPPPLLPLFPVTSPRVSESSS